MGTFILDLDYIIYAETEYTWGTYTYPGAEEFVDILQRLKYFLDTARSGYGTIEDFEAVYHCFENDNKNDKVSFVAATSQGYCFGEKKGNINIIKTIISEDMLFKNQIFIFNELKNAFKEANKERYGISYNIFKSHKHL